MTLEEYRRKHGLTQHELAERLGTNARQVRRWLQPGARPRLDALRLIEDKTGGQVRAQDFLGGSNGAQDDMTACEAGVAEAWKAGVEAHKAEAERAKAAKAEAEMAEAEKAGARLDEVEGLLVKLTAEENGLDERNRKRIRLEARVGGRAVVSSLGRGLVDAARKGELESVVKTFVNYGAPGIAAALPELSRRPHLAAALVLVIAELRANEASPPKPGQEA